VFLGQWFVKLCHFEQESNIMTVGQQEDWPAVEKKALTLGAEKMVILDLRKTFVDELVFPAIQSNAIYEDRYLLGTSLARPVIARSQVQVALENNCQFLSHGCVRFPF
jgi:argininosuccinate synthase